MYVEITKELFKKIVTVDVMCESVEDQELCRINHYVVDGVKLMIVDCYLTTALQYYIQDINA